MINYQTAIPSPVLAPYIKKYWSIDVTSEAMGECVERIVPGGMPEMIFYLGDLPGYHRPNAESPEAAMISGQQTGWYDIHTNGKMSLFAVLFRPEGLKALFRLPPVEIADSTISLINIMGRDAHMISERLSIKTTIWERKGIIEDYLIQRSIPCSDYSFLRIVDSVNIISQNRGCTDIGYLAKRCCLSIRQYERTFRSVTGITPIKFLRVIRFQNALDIRRRNPGTSLTALAADSGYYDQSHMISDFHKLSGLSPGEFFAQCEPYSDYFS